MMSAILEQTRAEWLAENFWIGNDGEAFWPKPGCRSFAAWLAEPVRPDRDRDVDSGVDGDG